MTEIQKGKASQLEVHAVLIGEPKTLEDGHGHSVQSAINKSVVHVPLFLTATHFEGDRQADQKNHGGVDKAVLAYSYNHYPYWEQRLAKPMSYGAFGENLTISGLTEEDVVIGDTFELDEAIIQVSQPRQPCFKIAFKHRIKQMPLWVEETGRSGIYFRVLKEGWVSPKPELKQIEKGHGTLTLSQLNAILFSKTATVDELREATDQVGAAESLKVDLLKKLAKIEKV